jgi:flagellar FliL protein
MSDAPAAEPPPPPAPKSKPSKVVLILLVLNLGASGFSTFKLVTAEPPAHAETAKKEAPTTSEVAGPVIALEPFVVNLDEPGQARYLKITLQLELVAAEAEHPLEQNKQPIRDAILSHLSGLKLADTLGTAAKDKLRTDLMTKITAIVGDHKVRRMFFQEFMVQ